MGSIRCLRQADTRKLGGYGYLGTSSHLRNIELVLVSQPHIDGMDQSRSILTPPKKRLRIDYYLPNAFFTPLEIRLPKFFPPSKETSPHHQTKTQPSIQSLNNYLQAGYVSTFGAREIHYSCVEYKLTRTSSHFPPLEAPGLACAIACPASSLSNPRPTALSEIRWRPYTNDNLTIAASRRHTKETALLEKGL